MNEIYRYALWVWYVIKAWDGLHMIIKIFRHLRKNYSASVLFLPPQKNTFKILQNKWRRLVLEAGSVIWEVCSQNKSLLVVEDSIIFLI